MPSCQVRIEKKAEILKARIEEAKNAGANLTSIATKMNVAIDTLDSISFNDYFLGKYGMEPKVQAAIATAEPNTLVGPIQGANGVYMIFVNNKVDNPTLPEVAAIRSQKQQGFMQGLRSIQQVLKDNAKVIDQRNKFGDIAVAEDRDVHARVVLHFANQCPVGRALVHLGLGAAMDAEGSDADVL